MLSIIVDDCIVTLVGLLIVLEHPMSLIVFIKLFTFKNIYYMTYW